VTTIGKNARLCSTAVILMALLVGTIWGDDDHFPFGPLRMYSVKNELDGRVRSLEVHGVTADGEDMIVPFEAFGMRKADVEGQLGKLQGPPESVLNALRLAHKRLDPEGTRFVKLRLAERVFILNNGYRVDERIETLAVWSSP
jgi:hypothetical protein